MSVRLAAYYRRKARSELRGELFYPCAMLSAGALGLAVNGWIHARAPLGWASLAGAAALAAVVYGLVRCRAWARWPAAVVLAVALVAAVAHALGGGSSSSAVLGMVVAASAVVFLAAPSTGALFARASPRIDRGAPCVALDGGDTQVLVPAIGDGSSSGTLLRWLAAEGDLVGVSDPLAEIRYEAAAVEIPSPRRGRVTARHLAEGAEARVHDPLLSLREDGDERG